MELFTPVEALTLSNLEFNEAVESAERAAVKCEIAGIAALIAKQEMYLALIRYQQAKTALALEIARSQS